MSARELYEVFVLLAQWELHLYQTWSKIQFANRCSCYILYISNCKYLFL